MSDWSRRKVLKSLSRTALVLPFADVLSLASPLGFRQEQSGQKVGAQPEYNKAPMPPPAAGPKSPIAGTPLGVQFVDVAAAAGLTSRTIYGGEGRNKYLLETTGCGVAFYDYDDDGWLDIFLVNGWRLEGFAKGQEPACHLFRNNRDGTFTDVSAKSGIASTGWGQGCCIGDYNNDGHDDLFLSYYGKVVLYRNNGDGTFTDMTEKAGLVQPGKPRWNTGCAMLDYNRDGHLDIFVANYIDMDLKTAPTPESGPCTYKSILVACGPPGLPGGKNILYHNNGDGTFTDVSEKAGMWNTIGTYGLSVAVGDFDNDGWPDIYVADDSIASILYVNQKDGTFKDQGIEAGAALSPDGKPQAGMGVGIGDYNHDGNLDILKTNFAGDTDSLYQNMGDGTFEDHTYESGLGVNTRYLGWGVGFLDFDNDGWLDIFMANGHVYPEVSGSRTEAPYKEQKYLYRNLRNGRFEDVSSLAGPGMTSPVASRGCAFGDYNNDGCMDVVINCVNDVPQLLRADSTWNRGWIKIKTVGVKSNRTGVGARIRVTADIGGDGKMVTQTDEVRSGGSYFSQSDLRVHFGLGAARNATVEVRWPSGQVDVLKSLDANRLYVVQEGGKILRAEEMKGFAKKR